MAHEKYYDVFLSPNSVDKPTVEYLAQKLLGGCGARSEQAFEELTDFGPIKPQPTSRRAL